MTLTTLRYGYDDSAFEALFLCLNSGGGTSGGGTSQRDRADRERGLRQGVEKAHQRETRRRERERQQDEADRRSNDEQYQAPTQTTGSNQDNFNVDTPSNDGERTTGQALKDFGKALRDSSPTTIFNPKASIGERVAAGARTVIGAALGPLGTVFNTAVTGAQAYELDRQRQINPALREGGGRRNSSVNSSSARNDHDPNDGHSEHQPRRRTFGAPTNPAQAAADSGSTSGSAGGTSDSGSGGAAGGGGNPATAQLSSRLRRRLPLGFNGASFATLGGTSTTRRRTLGS